ncbi:TAP42-like protein [Cokeromyces recurvatus]|uniref:TAP42-like protein n=1 Tax=Cokeromyces recurvatus TaxID=90255 RepID=UPI002220BB30|nr:TAP42-like protein [Cokeromyces recurvatus]KAI7904528.1 TAP42-like protein [Cokeromyces recurvatus]
MTSIKSLDDLSLGQLFSLGQSILNELEDTTLSSIDPEYQAKVKEGLQYLLRADDLISKLHLFSDNEILEDINTNDLKFLLTSAYLGELNLKLAGPNTNRRVILETSKEYIHRFLSTCQDHALIQTKEDVTLLEQLANNMKGRPSLNPQQQREQKIARFKREKAVKEQIRNLRQQLDETDKNNEDRDVDDVEREWVQALIELEIMKVLESWHGIEQELVMVKEMEMMQQMQERSGKKLENVQQQQQQQPISRQWGKDKPILSKEGRPLQPFVIMNKREQLRSQVFGYSHNLPTMTIDEYLEQERQRGNIIEGGGEPPEKEPINDNDYEALDAETMKKREWDEFVEANPRGAGNRMNKG